MEANSVYFLYIMFTNENPPRFQLIKFEGGSGNGAFTNTILSGNTITFALLKSESKIPQNILLRSFRISKNHLLKNNIAVLERKICRKWNCHHPSSLMI